MLYLCATPIGNLADITDRVKTTLGQCDAVYCEDTRRTTQLLNHLGIKKPVISCHMHNEHARADEVVELLSQGKDICYCSDAGMPAISDPGSVLVRACIDNSLDFTVLPGASAALMAAVLSGLPIQPFTFIGFLPRDNKQRRETLSMIAGLNHLCIIYESPHRVRATLKELYGVLGDCRAAVMRELTKLHESVYRGTLSTLIEQFSEEPKGECVIAVLVEKCNSQPTEDDMDKVLLSLLRTMSVKDAASEAAAQLKLPKKQCYRRALELANEDGEALAQID